MSDEIDNNGSVAGNVFALVILPERSTTILLEFAGLSISARIAEPALAKPAIPLRVGPDPVTRMPPRPVALCSAKMPRPPDDEYVPDPPITMLPLPVEVARTPPVLHCGGVQPKYPETVP